MDSPRPSRVTVVIAVALTCITMEKPSSATIVEADATVAVSTGSHAASRPRNTKTKKTRLRGNATRSALIRSSPRIWLDW
jgi:hypothetical protein